MPGLLQLITGMAQREAQKQELSAHTELLRHEAEAKKHEARVRKAEADRAQAEIDFLSHPDIQRHILGGTQSFPSPNPTEFAGEENQQPTQVITPPASMEDLLSLLARGKAASGDISGITPLAAEESKLRQLKFMQSLFGGQQPPAGGGIPQGATPIPENPAGAGGPVNMKPGGPSGALMNMTPDQLAGLKMGGTDLSGIRKLFQPEFAFEKGMTKDGKIGVFSIDKKTGKPSAEPILISQNPQWDFSPPQKTATGIQIIEFRKDLGLQGSINAGQYALHQIGGPEYEIKEKTLPDGSKSISYIPKIPNPMAAATGGAGGQQISPPTGEMRIPDEQLPKFQNAQGQNPPAGTTFNGAATQGFTPVSPAQEAQNVNQEFANSVIGDIEKAVKNKNIFNIESPSGRLVGGIKNKIASRTQMNPDMTHYEDVIKLAGLSLLRGLFTGGRINSATFSAAQNSLPELTDTQAVARKKVAYLKKILGDVKWAGRPGEKGEVAKSDPLGLR